MDIKKSEVVNYTIFTTEEAAIYLGLKRSFLYKLTHNKKIPFHCPNGKKNFFKREDLDAWMLQNRVSTIDEVNQAADSYLMKKKLGRNK